MLFPRLKLLAERKLCEIVPCDERVERWEASAHTFGLTGRVSTSVTLRPAEALIEPSRSIMSDYGT
jgi:hypothetical protein